MALTEQEEHVITCAYADLRGSLQAFVQGNSSQHDWEGHTRTVLEMEKAFPFVVDVPPEEEE